MIVIEPSPPPGRMLRTLGSGLLRANSAHGPSFAAQWTCHDIWEFTWLEKNIMWYSDTKCWHICDKKNKYFRTKMQPYSFLQWLEMCFPGLCVSSSRKLLQKELIIPCNYAEPILLKVQEQVMKNLTKTFLDGPSVKSISYNSDAKKCKRNHRFVCFVFSHCTSLIFCIFFFSKVNLL